MGWWNDRDNVRTQNIYYNMYNVKSLLISKICADKKNIHLNI
jgi:hypothetical protein